MDYSKIDEKCRDIVRTFNKIGLTTEFSCEGHGQDDFYIVFSTDVTDDMIDSFLYKIAESKPGHLLGRMCKWVRRSHINGGAVVAVNWMYVLSSHYAYYFDREKDDLKTIKTVFGEVA